MPFAQILIIILISSTPLAPPRLARAFEQVKQEKKSLFGEQGVLAQVR